MAKWWLRVGGTAPTVDITPMTEEQRCVSPKIHNNAASALASTTNLDGRMSALLLCVVCAVPTDDDSTGLVGHWVEGGCWGGALVV